MDSLQDNGSIGAAGSAAEAFLNSANAEGTSQGTQTDNTNPATQQTATPVASQTPVASSGQQPLSSQDAPTPLALEDAKTYLWTNPETGATEPKTGKEIKAGWMMQSAFTKKTQEVAALKKQLEPYIQEREQVAGILRDPNAYLQFAAQHLGPQAVQQLMAAIAQQAAGQQQVPQLDPNGIATVGQAEQIARQQLGQLQQEFQALQAQMQQLVTGAKQELRDEQEVKGYNEQINPVLKAVFEANPILSVVPNAEESIRWEVLQMHKRGEISNVQQAAQAFRDVATKHANAITSKWQELQKQSIASQQSLVTNGIEPPGGVLVQHQGGAYKAPQRQDGRVDFDAMGRDVEAFIKSHMAG